MSKNAVANIEIRLTPIANQSNAYEFHQQNLTEFLLPRSNERFLAMIKDREVYEAFDHVSQKLVGICYITKDHEVCGSPERAEFGGVFVSGDYRKSHLAYALASFAISKFSLDNTADFERLVAHVHQYNHAPLKLIRRLGFRCFGAEIPPLDHVKSMKRNKCGYVIGLLFVFWKRFFSDMGCFFETLERENFTFQLQSGDFATVKFDLLEDTDWNQFSLSVKGLSKESSYKLVHGCTSCIKKSAMAWLKTHYT